MHGTPPVSRRTWASSPFPGDSVNSPQYFSCGAWTAVEVPSRQDLQPRPVPERRYLQGVLKIVVRIVKGKGSAARVRSAPCSTSAAGASVHPHPAAQEGGHGRREDAEDGEEHHRR